MIESEDKVTTDQKIFCLGDIHGCHLELIELLEKIGWSRENKEIRIISLGDLLDRGPMSVEVVQFIRKNNIELVRGNHDDKYVQLWEKIKWHEKNPGNVKPAWLAKYPERIKILFGLTEEDILWLKNAPTSICLEDYKTVLVHAGFMPGVPLADQKDNTKMHIRFLFDNAPAFLEKHNNYNPPVGSRFWAEDYLEDWHVVYGHHVWDLEFIKIHTNPKGYSCYGIDTGACFGGSLSALELSKDGQHKIHQVKAKKNYAKK
jgi:serine/threonine protein phosphatase 1